MRMASGMDGIVKCLVTFLGADYIKNGVRITRYGGCWEVPFAIEDSPELGSGLIRTCCISDNGAERHHSH